MSNIIDRVKKLLALANNAGATEHEAARALEMAQSLIMKHGIDAMSLGEKARVGLGDMINEETRWQTLLAQAVGYLYGVRLVIHRNVGFKFAGRLDNIDAATVTLPFIADQVERLYKVALPKSLSKTARAEFRRTFKDACAIRVGDRIARIVADQTTKDAAAQGAGGTALVVRKHRAELDDDAHAALNAIPGLRQTKSRAITIKPTTGAAAGYRAGEQVRIHQEVK